MNDFSSIGKARFRYNHIIGTGGIGSGIFFSFEENATLGRNESRLATLEPSKDFCKQHIILHYVSVLLGAGSANGFRCYPIGKVGNDTPGLNLLAMMSKTGMTTSGVTILNTHPTLFSVCFQYPDTNGGNITSNNSASSQLLPADIIHFFETNHIDPSNEMILVAPEVPVITRVELLKAGRRRSSFNVACLLSGEANYFLNNGVFKLVDLLSINIDEAAAIAGLNKNVDDKSVIQKCIDTITTSNPKISVLITNGKEGSYCFHDGQIYHTPVIEVKPISTAGAGDAFLSGTLTGLCAGLPLIDPARDNSVHCKEISCAVDLGTLLASLSVTSPDTIHLDADAELLYKFARENGVRFDRLTPVLFSEPQQIKHFRKI